MRSVPLGTPTGASWEAREDGLRRRSARPNGKYRGKTPPERDDKT
jgi:hypothetical protein